jgi:hypothetical protein
MNVQNTELTAVSNAVAEFDRVAAGLADLKQRFHGVIYDVATTKGMTEAKEARAAIRAPRFEVERIRKEAKAPILALGKKLDSEAARITKELLTLEEPVDEVIKAEEARKETERQAKIAAEIKRVADLQERVAELRGNQFLIPANGSALIAEHIADLEAAQVDETFQEFRQQAEDAKAAGLARLRELHAAAVAHEAEAERIRQEREELARLRAEQARRDAEAAEQRAEAERQARIERERLEAEARVRREAEEAELRRQREEEAAEQQRVERIRQWIIALNGPTHLTATDSPTLIRQAMQGIHNAKITAADYGEFLAEAMDAQVAGSKRLQDLLSAAEEYRAEQQRIADERAELDRQRAENEQREREARERQEAEARRLAEERAQFAREQEAARKASEPEHVVLSGVPTALEIVEALAIHYDESQEMALDWLRDVDWCAVSLQQEQAA